MVPVIIVSGSKGIFSNDNGDLQDTGKQTVGQILLLAFGATLSKIESWHVSISTATSEMHQCHWRIYFNSSI